MTPSTFQLSVGEYIRAGGSVETLAIRCSVAVSTVHRWARGASCPGIHVRQFVCDQIRELEESP